MIGTIYLINIIYSADVIYDRNCSEYFMTFASKFNVHKDFVYWEWLAYALIKMSFETWWLWNILNSIQH